MPKERRIGEKMKKEIIITCIVVIAVVVGNIVTQNYTNQCSAILTEELLELKDTIKTGEKQEKEEKIKEIYEKWNGMQEKLAFYIEHNELEKVETQVSVLKGNIEAGLDKESFPEIERCNFIIEHIKDKNIIEIKNIF